jgi:Domain of unknown function (DUF3883)
MRDKSIWETAIIETISESGGSSSLQTIYESVRGKIKYNTSIDFEHSVRGYLSRLKNSKKILTQNKNGEYCFNSEIINKSNKHENYEILNLLAYGLAKFNEDFLKQFDCKNYTTFYNHFVSLGICDTGSSIKLRRDLIDPFFDNDRVGYANRGDTYRHRKDSIELLFGKEVDVKTFADIVKLYLADNFEIGELKTITTSPIIKSKFKRLQETGQEAELYFKENYHKIEPFKDGILEDARLLGDGYDFQIQIESEYFLAEVKGIRKTYGGFRMTEKEFARADEYKNDYGLIIISNLENIPKMTAVFNPIASIVLERQERTTQQISYHSKSMSW